MIYVESMIRSIVEALLLLVTTSLLAFSHGSQDAKCDNRKKSSQTLASCKYDEDCMKNAYCWNQESCLCKDGYLVDRHNRTHVQCLPVAKALGDDCIKDVQCSVVFAAQAECRENTCQCTLDSHFEQGRCYQTAGLGDLCQTSHNCRIEGSDSFCVSGYCTCPLQHHPNADGTRCLKSAFLMDNCSSDEECVVRNSRCLEICKCEVDYTLSLDRKRCLKVASSVDDYCEEDSQCSEFLENAVCESNRCRCMRKYHQRGAHCFRDVELKAACEVHEECITRSNGNSSSREIRNVDCLYGLCMCADGYTLVTELLDCVPHLDPHFNGATSLYRIPLLFLTIVYYLCRVT